MFVEYVSIFAAGLSLGLALQRLAKKPKEPEEAWFIGDDYRTVARIQGAPSYTYWYIANSTEKTKIRVWAWVYGKVPSDVQQYTLEGVQDLKRVDTVFFNSERKVSQYINHTGKLKAGVRDLDLTDVRELVKIES